LSFTGEHDEYPGVMAGDVIVKIRIEDHKLFKRVGADLLINKKNNSIRSFDRILF